MINRFEFEYHFLSNFYQHPQEFEGAIYPTVEHAFQAAKSHDPKVREKIRTADTPGRAKKLGRKVALRPDWETVKMDIMFDLLKTKFDDGVLKTKLYETIPHELIEGNWWGDTFWGVCEGIGENRLGKLLMKVRDGI